MYYKSKSTKSKDIIGRKQAMEKVSYKSKYSPFKRFTNSIHAKETERTYVYHLKNFLEYTGLKTHERLIELANNYDDDKDLNQTFDMIQNYIQYMVKEKKLAPQTVNTAIASIKLFYDVNRIKLIDWKELSRLKGKRRPVIDDRTYTEEELKTLIEHADIREKVAILTLLTTGMRVGALATLKMGDIEYLAEYKLYKFIPYSNDLKERYITFCTPECASAINRYLKHRAEKEGEKITKDSAFITHKITSTRRFKDKGFLSSKALQKILERQRYDANIMSIAKMGTIEKSKKQFGKTRKAVMRAHGFRKYFNTACIDNNVNHTVKEFLMGHKTGMGLDLNYFRSKDNKLLVEYLKVIESLTISEEKKLSKQVQELKAENEEKYDLITRKFREKDKQVKDLHLKLQLMDYDLRKAKEREEFYKDVDKKVEQMGKNILKLENKYKNKKIVS